MAAGPASMRRTSSSEPSDCMTLRKYASEHGRTASPEAASAARKLAPSDSLSHWWFRCLNSGPSRCRGTPQSSATFIWRGSMNTLPSGSLRISGDLITSISTLQTSLVAMSEGGRQTFLWRFHPRFWQAWEQ